MSRSRVIGLVLSALMVVVGAIWALQGLGYLEGSPMTGEEFWAIVGSVLAGFGVALAIVVLRPPQR